MTAPLLFENKGNYHKIFNSLKINLGMNLWKLTKEIRGENFQSNFWEQILVSNLFTVLPQTTNGNFVRACSILCGSLSSSPGCYFKEKKYLHII